MKTSKQISYAHSLVNVPEFQIGKNVQNSRTFGSVNTIQMIIKHIDQFNVLDVFGWMTSDIAEDVGYHW